MKVGDGGFDIQINCKKVWGRPYMWLWTHLRVLVTTNILAFFNSDNIFAKEITYIIKIMYDFKNMFKFFK